MRRDVQHIDLVRVAAVHQQGLLIPRPIGRPQAIFTELLRRSTGRGHVHNPLVLLVDGKRDLGAGGVAHRVSLHQRRGRHARALSPSPSSLSQIFRSTRLIGSKGDKASVPGQRRILVPWRTLRNPLGRSCRRSAVQVERQQPDISSGFDLREGEGAAGRAGGTQVASRTGRQPLRADRPLCRFAATIRFATDSSCRRPVWRTSLCRPATTNNVVPERPGPASSRCADRLQAGLDERVVGASSYRVGAICRDHPPVDARTVECPGGGVSHDQQMLPVLVPDWIAGRCEIRPDSTRLSPAHWNHPDGAAPRHRGGDAPRTHPIRHLRSVRRKTRIEAVSGDQPRISAKRWHLVDATAIPVRPKHDPTPVRREIGHHVAGAIERQTDRRASRHMFDIEIEPSAKRICDRQRRWVGRIRHQPAIGRQRRIIRDPGIGCEPSELSMAAGGPKNRRSCDAKTNADGEAHGGSDVSHHRAGRRRLPARLFGNRLVRERTASDSRSRVPMKRYPRPVAVSM